jgi:putative tryptophan/tyrosine transport system substrate-binding protein
MVKTGLGGGRRQFVKSTAFVLVALTAARAQAQNKLPVVAVLHSQSAPPPEALARDPLRPRLRELGWELGKTVDFLPLYADGSEQRLRELAAEAVAKQVAVIVTAGGEATRAAKQATDTLPIVAIGPNLLAMGYAASLARPGGNVTGPSLSAGPGLAAKQLELLKLALPQAKRIAYLHNSGQTRGATEAAAAAAHAHGLALAALVIDGSADFDAAFAELRRNRPDAIWVADSAANTAHRSRITEFAARERLPAVYGNPQFAVDGGLMTYGVNLFERIRSAAGYVDKILRGARAGDLPIEQATTLELVLNLKTARAIGLTFPQALLLSADRVIE